MFSSFFKISFSFPGGRITVLQGSLPNAGPGSVPAREIQAGSGQDKNASSAGLLGPATDFYKKLALDCSGQQVSTDGIHPNLGHPLFDLVNFASFWVSESVRILGHPFSNQYHKKFHNCFYFVKKPKVDA